MSAAERPRVPRSSFFVPRSEESIVRRITFDVRRSETKIRRALLAWYDRVKRPLPWRRSRDPYRVWVAEVMLQQTRIQVVAPAYRRFLRVLPTMARLARAGEDEVLSLWSGLGYYSRARALHLGARLLQERGESFPRDHAAALALPGVGAYTAAAVLSIAYDEPHAAVDGNIVRVLSRLARLPRPDGRGEPHRALADELLDRRRPGDWNQAMMELGETVCLPKSPRCQECPLANWCEARLHAEVELHPPPKPRRRTERQPLHLTVVRDRQGRVLLERGAFPHLKHMWLPLLSACSAVGRAVPGPPRKDMRTAPRRAGDGPPYSRANGSVFFRHAILHREFEVEVDTHLATAAEMRKLLAPANGAERRLFTADELARIGRSSLLTKALAQIPQLKTQNSELKTLPNSGSAARDV